MHRNNLSHEFLLFYLGHSMKSRRSQSIRIIGFFNRFHQRSRNSMTVNVNTNITSKVVKVAKSDKLSKDLFVFFSEFHKRRMLSKIVPLQPYSSTLIDMWLCQAVG